MDDKEKDRAQSSDGFHATVEAETPEELDRQLHAVIKRLGRSHGFETKPSAE